MDGELDVVVLSGNPGDGKTSFLVQVGAALDEAGAVTLHEDAAGWRKRLGGRTFVAVYDASESHGSCRPTLCCGRHSIPATATIPHRRTVLLAANDGRIAQFCGDHRERYPELAAELERQLRGAGSAGRTRAWCSSTSSAVHSRCPTSTGPRWAPTSSPR